MGRAEREQLGHAGSRRRPGRPSGACTPSATHRPTGRGPGRPPPAPPAGAATYATTASTLGKVRSGAAPAHFRPRGRRQHRPCPAPPLTTCVSAARGSARGGLGSAPPVVGHEGTDRCTATPTPPDRGCPEVSERGRLEPRRAGRACFPKGGRVLAPRAPARNHTAFPSAAGWSPKAEGVLQMPCPDRQGTARQTCLYRPPSARFCFWGVGMLRPQAFGFETSGLSQHSHRHFPASPGLLRLTLGLSCLHVPQGPLPRWTL